MVRGRIAAPPRLPRGWSAEGSRHRRGRHVDIPRSGTTSQRRRGGRRPRTRFDRDRRAPPRYTKPKKAKHVRKKDKLRVLRFYKIEDDGKVTRLRKYSPAAGTAGCFMAQHFDRYYCGKTGHTYFYNQSKGESA